MKALWVTGVVLVLITAGVGGWKLRRVNPSAPNGEQGALVAVSEGLPDDQIWRQDFVFADMDGDGVRDLITAPPRKSKEPWPHIFLRTGDRWEQACVQVPRGGFPGEQEYNYGGVAVADFNGDRIPDISLAMHETGIRILHGQKAGPCGPWEERTDLPEAMLTLRSRSLVAADMNQDGRPDLVALSEAAPLDRKVPPRGILIFWNEPSGWRVEALPGSEGLFGDDIAVGEVNGDGIPDIAVGVLMDNRPQFVWLSEGAGQWKPAPQGLPEHIVAWSVQLSDLDDDGQDELILGTSGAPFRKNAGPRVYHWDGERWQDLSLGLPQVSWVCGVGVADLDGDGRKELVAAEMYTGIIQVYNRQEDGVWKEQQKITIPNPQGLRNYKVRIWRDDSTKQEQVVVNYAGGNGGRIMAWAWR